MRPGRRRKRASAASIRGLPKPAPNSRPDCRRFSMAAALELRDDFTGDDLRRLARSSRDAKQVRRLLALSAVRDGGSRTEAARIGGVGLQIVRDWVVRFNAEGPAGLVDRKAPGKRPTLTSTSARRWADRGGGPSPGPTGWCAAADPPRAVALGSVPGLGERGDGQSGAAGARFRKLSARPRHYAQDPEAAEVFKKASRSAWRRSGTPIPASA